MGIVIWLKTIIEILFPTIFGINDRMVTIRWRSYGRTDTNPLFKYNQAERNYIKKHEPSNKEILDKTNSNNIDNNKIEIAKNKNSYHHLRTSNRQKPKQVRNKIVSI